MNQRGFTLLEVLLSVAIMGLLTGLSLPVYQSFANKNNLDITSQQMVAMLRRAQSYARANKNDSVWGVEVQSTSATLFQGTSFASRVQSYDETLALPATVTPSGITEVQFSKLTAAPNTTGTVTLTQNANTIRTITVNAKGMVEY